MPPARRGVCPPPCAFSGHRSASVCKPCGRIQSSDLPQELSRAPQGQCPVASQIRPQRRLWYDHSPTVWTPGTASIASALNVPSGVRGVSARVARASRDASRRPLTNAQPNRVIKVNRFACPVVIFGFPVPGGGPSALCIKTRTTEVPEVRPRLGTARCDPLVSRRRPRSRSKNVDGPQCPRPQGRK